MDGGDDAAEVSVVMMTAAVYFWLGVLYVPPDRLEASFIGTQGTDHSVRVWLLSGNNLLQAKTPLVIGGTQTQVLYKA